MSVHFAMIARSRDGLPLAGSTDGSPIEQDPDYQEAYKDLKLLSRKTGNFTFSDRCSYPCGRFSIHFISAIGLTFLVLTDASYPPVLAFSFLNEIMKEFLQEHDHKTAENISRPYAYINFAMFIQKTKSKYNSPRSLMTKLNFSALTQEYELRPPYNISNGELYPEIGTKTSSFRTAASSRRHYVSFDIFGWVATGLNILCAFLHLARGIAVIQDGHIEDYSSDLFQYGLTFMLCCGFFLYQVFLMCFPTSMRKPLACGTLGSICVCQLYLWEYRTNVEILFHVCVGCTATFVIFTRKIQEKLPQYNL
ncbi:hypothetical protein SNE40_022212 [Patella caerulea]|uniref:Longin domain-containing protein n=1 Tax=Patella caerulea TaxID=87958 RepID=A0AAN8FW93_PATCE